MAKPQPNQNKIKSLIVSPEDQINQNEGDSQESDVAQESDASTDNEKSEEDKVAKAPVVSAPGKVKVRFLKHVMQYVPGQVEEFDLETAKHLVQFSPSVEGFDDNRRAVYEDQALQMESENLRIENMTVGEAMARGIVNRVDSSPKKAVGE